MNLRLSSMNNQSDRIASSKKIDQTDQTLFFRRVLQSYPFFFGEASQEVSHPRRWWVFVSLETDGGVQKMGHTPSEKIHLNGIFHGKPTIFIYFNRIFHGKPSIFGYPPLMEAPRYMILRIGNFSYSFRFKTRLYKISNWSLDFALYLGNWRPILCSSS